MLKLINYDIHQSSTMNAIIKHARIGNKHLLFDIGKLAEIPDEYFENNFNFNEQKFYIFINNNYSLLKGHLIKVLHMFSKLDPDNRAKIYICYPSKNKLLKYDELNMLKSNTGRIHDYKLVPFSKDMRFRVKKKEFLHPAEIKISCEKITVFLDEQKHEQIDHWKLDAAFVVHSNY